MLQPYEWESVRIGRYTHSSLVTFDYLNVVTAKGVEQSRIGIVAVVGRDVTAAALPTLLERSTILELYGACLDRGLRGVDELAERGEISDGLA